MPAGRVVAAVLALAAMAAGATPRCDGRFLVRTASGPLVAPAATVVVVDARAVALDPACGAAGARIRRVRGGWRVAARWAMCGAHRRVRLRARLAADCTALQGSIAARHAARTAFLATRSVCGDGAVDAGGGEGCDDGNTRGGDPCEASCVPCDPTAAPVASTWAGVQLNVVERYGCTACHDGRGTGSLDLRPAAALAALRAVPSVAAPPLPRVAPGDPAGSVLWLKLAKSSRPIEYDAVPGGGMPPEDHLSGEELAAVARWIAAGAPAEGVVPDTDVLRARCRAR